MESAWNRGHLKYGDNGEIEAVFDPSEREHLASTIKKEREDAAILERNLGIVKDDDDDEEQIDS